MDAQSLTAFKRKVRAYYQVHGRHALPWRKTHDPYRILVSEVMLQQTQVERVIPYYEAWMKHFPNVKALAKAPLSEALRLWQGLGYNRRAKMLHEAGKALAKLPEFPRTPQALEQLPGIGPYTARAVMAFAFNTDVVLIETNIRTVITHHFFPKKKVVHDRDIERILELVRPQGQAREWYAALMDYGAHLKRSGVRLNTRAKGYVKQKAFTGSMREARGTLLKALMREPLERKTLVSLLGPSRRAQMRLALSAMKKEGMVALKTGKFHLPA